MSLVGRVDQIVLDYELVLECPDLDQLVAGLLEKRLTNAVDELHSAGRLADWQYLNKCGQTPFGFVVADIQLDNLLVRLLWFVSVVQGDDAVPGEGEVACEGGDHGVDFVETSIDNELDDGGVFNIGIEEGADDKVDAVFVAILQQIHNPQQIQQFLW